MNVVTLSRFRVRWLLAMVSCLSQAGDVAPTGGAPSADGEPSRKPGKSTTMERAATAGAKETSPGASFSPAESTAKLERFVVSADHAMQLAPPISLPVEIITAEEIGTSGMATNIQEALRKIVPQFMGSANAGAESVGINSGIMGGGSSLAYRNLSTLVLINGRRFPVSPVSAQQTTLVPWVLSNENTRPTGPGPRSISVAVVVQTTRKLDVEPASGLST